MLYRYVCFSLQVSYLLIIYLKSFSFNPVVAALLHVQHDILQSYLPLTQTFTIQMQKI